MPNSSTSPRQKVASKLKLLRLPLWAPTLLLVAAGVLGFIFSLGSGSVGIFYLIFFAVGAVIGTLFVKPQGLMLAVSQIPLLFAVITPVVSWFLTSIADPSEGGATDSTPTKTRLITAAYPVVQYFPWLAAILGICIVLALWRYFELTRINSKQQISERKEAKRRKEQSQKSNESATRARRRMAESDERLSSHRRDGVRRHGVRHATEQMRPASDIIRDAQQRRMERAERFQRTREEAWQEAQRRNEEMRKRAAARSTERPAARHEHDAPRPAQPVREPRRPAAHKQPQQPQQQRPQQSRSEPQPQQRLWGEVAAAAPNRREAAPRQRPARAENPREPRRGQTPQYRRDARREFPIDREAMGSRNTSDRRRGYADEWPPRHERPRHPMRRDTRDQRPRD